MAYSTSSFQATSGQVEAEYLWQVLHRGQESVHEHFCINRIVYKVTSAPNDSGQKTYYPLTEQVPHNYSIRYQIKYPIESMGLNLYAKVVQNRSVLATARMLDLFHSMNDGDNSLECLPEIIGFDSIQNSCSTSTIPSNQQLEKLYLNSIFFQGYNSTHNEFYVKNLKLKITKTNATHYQVSFYNETAVANASLKNADAETIRNRVSLLVNDSRVQVVAQQHVLRNQSECLSHVINAKCADIAYLLPADPSFQNLMFKTGSRHWKNEVCEFTSNCSAELLPDLFKIVPVHEALQSMLKVQLEKFPLVFILMRLDVLKRTQPFRASQFLEEVLQVKYPANEGVRTQVITAHLNKVKDDIEEMQTDSYSKLCDEGFIKNCYLHSIMERGLNETHHLFHIENFGFNISLCAETFEYTVINIESTDFDSFMFTPKQKQAIIKNIQCMLSGGDTFQQSIQAHNGHIERLVQSVHINERLTAKILEYKDQQATQNLANIFNSEYSDLRIYEWLPIISSKQTQPKVSSLKQLNEFESLSRTVGVWLCQIALNRQCEPDKALILLKRIQKVLPRELHNQELQLNKLELDLHEDNVQSALKNDISPIQDTKPHLALRKLSILMNRTPKKINEKLRLADIRKPLEQQVNQQLESDLVNREYLLEALSESRELYGTDNTRQEIVLKHLSVQLEVNDNQKVVVCIDGIRTDILGFEYSSAMKYHIKNSIECCINGTYKNLEHKLALIQTYKIQIDKTNEICPIMHTEFEEGDEVIEIRLWTSDQWVVIGKAVLLAYFDSGQTAHPVTRKKMLTDDIRSVSSETIKALNRKYEDSDETIAPIS